MTSETSDASPRSRSRSFSKKPVPAAKAKPKTVAGLERDADRFAKAARSAKLKAIEMVRREKLRVQRALVKELMTEQKQLTRLGTANLKASKKALATLDSMERIDANFKAARAKKVD